MKFRVSVHEAQAIVRAHAMPVGAVRMPVAGSLGRTLRGSVHAGDDLPPFDNSAMDGYAVRVSDCAALPVELRIQETITAGRLPQRAVVQGTCASIMTGAPVPEGADAIVPVEWTAPAGPDRVRINRVPARGMYVRRAGQDAARGTCAVAEGAVITPQILGMIAAAGAHEVEVSRLPRVAIVATGDELHTKRGPLPRGKIRDINGPLLAALVQTAGALPHGPYYAQDNAASLRTVLARASRGCDVLLVSGGVSVGAHDLVKDILREMGLVLQFWRVRQRPGGPLAFGLLDGCAVFGLPGNPVSSAVCFDQYVRLFLAAMLQRSDVHRPRLRATLVAETQKNPGLHWFVRGFCRVGEDGRLAVRDTGPQASNLFSSMARANCIIHLEEAMERAPAGTAVTIEPLTWPTG